MTPQLLQSIRLLQLNAQQLAMEVHQALERNPLLEHEDDEEIGETTIDDDHDADPAFENASWDELPEPTFTGSQAGGGFDDDGMQRIAAGESSDPRQRLLDELRLELGATDWAMAAWWLDRCDDRGYLEGDLDTALGEGKDELRCDIDALRCARLRLLHGPVPGVAAADVAECLGAQLRALPEHPLRTLALSIVGKHLELLASGQPRALADALDADADDVSGACALIASLRSHPFETTADTGAVIPDVVAWRADGGWQVALNEHGQPRVRIAPHCEQALSGAGIDRALRGLMDEARWLLRGIAMRNDTLLRTAKVLVERQAGFLERGEEAIMPLTLREVADAIGMHESTVSRITTGKYIQTPRGTLELKRFFAVQLDGKEISGPAVRAMVKRIIDEEPAHAPLSDDHVTALLARRGIQIARRTVAKYRDQLDILPVRARARANKARLSSRTGSG